MLGQATASQLEGNHGPDGTVRPGGGVAPGDHESPRQRSPEVHEATVVMDTPKTDNHDAMSEAALSDIAPTEVHGEPTPNQEPFDTCACRMLRITDFRDQ